MSSFGPTQTKEKRSVASGRRRRYLLLLVTHYQKLQAKYPALREDIQNDIDGHLRQAARTRSADRRAVLDAIEEWQDARLPEATAARRAGVTRQ